MTLETLKALTAIMEARPPSIDEQVKLARNVVHQSSEANLLGEAHIGVQAVKNKQQTTNKNSSV